MKKPRRKRKSKRIERNNLTSKLVYKLIMDGAKLLQPPKFLGSNRQSYETILQVGYCGGKIKIYHKKSLDFITEPDGWPTFIP